MDEVHQITCLSLSTSEVSGDDGWLSPVEHAVQSKLHLPKRRADWRLGRWTAKHAVQRHYSESKTPLLLNQIEVLAASDGAPELFINGRRAELAISISHSGGHGFVALGANQHALGCDIEKVEPRSPAFISDYFTETEQAIYRETEAAHQPVLANLIWSAKESVSKALRQGLRLDTRSVQIELLESGRPDAGPFRASFSMDGQSFRGRWCVSHGFVRTIATNSPTLNIRHFQS